MAAWTRILKTLGRENGSVTVIMALAMTALVSMAALAADVGVNYLSQVQIAVAADAAALAGGIKLDAGKDAAIRAAQEIARENGLAAEQVIIDVGDDLRSITVRARAPLQLFFARLFSSVEGVMEQSARVAKTRPTAMEHVFPLGVDEAVQLVYSQRVNLFDKELLGGGQWGALSFEDESGRYTGAKVLEEFLKNGFSGIIEIGDLVRPASGVKMSAIRDGISYRIAEAAKTHTCTLGSCPPDCPRLLILPVYKTTAFEKELVIVDFAAFWVSSLEGQGSKTKVWGHFVRQGVRAAASAEGESPYGLTAVSLVR